MTEGLCDYWAGSFQEMNLIGPEHVFGIERQLNFFPVVIVLGLEHVERLTGQHGSHRAVARGHRSDAAAIDARKWWRREAAVTAKLDGDIDDQLVRVLHADRRTPECHQPCTQRVDLGL